MLRAAAAILLREGRPLRETDLGPLWDICQAPVPSTGRCGEVSFALPGGGRGRPGKFQVISRAEIPLEFDNMVPPRGCRCKRIEHHET